MDMIKVTPDQQTIYVHVTTNLWEAGSVLGSGAGAVLAVIRRSPRLQSFGSLPILLSGAGFLLGFPSAYFLMSSNKGESVAEQADKIRKDREQNRRDKFSYVGAIAGLGIGAVATSGPLIGNSLRAGIVGCALAQLVLFAEKYTFPEKHKKGSAYPPWRW